MTPEQIEEYKRYYRAAVTKSGEESDMRDDILTLIRHIQGEP